nr:MAG TPA: hypothetical protein [Caudoviricetes sp.]
MTAARGLRAALWGFPLLWGEALFLCVYKAFTPLLRLWQKGRKCACVLNISCIRFSLCRAEP